MASVTLTLVVVRHGEATHNLPQGHPQHLLKWNEEGDLDTQLTHLGKEQARLVGERLAHTNFDLAVSSDLERTRETARSILNRSGQEGKLVLWKMVRERKLGVLEKNFELVLAQLAVERAVEDRQLLVWAPPGGESAVDLNTRVKKFLSCLEKAASSLLSPCPTVLVVSHALWMKELYRVMAGPGAPGKKYSGNTGLDQYKVELCRQEDGGLLVGHLHCVLLSCTNHLQ